MSGAPGHPLLRRRIAAALGEYVAELGTRGVGELLGHSSSTISRRGIDLAQWPAAELLELAAMHPPLSQSLCVYLTGDQGEAEPQAARVVREVQQTITSAGELIATSSRSLADGRIDQGEAREIRTAIVTMGGQLRDLMHHLDAIDQGGAA